MGAGGCAALSLLNHKGCSGRASSIEREWESQKVRGGVMKRERYGEDVGVPTLHVLPTRAVAPLQCAVSGCVLAQRLEMAGIRKAAPSPGAGGEDDFWARTSPAQS